MSRSFPYPPPGYTGNEESYEALIKSIKLRTERELKLQRERKQAKAERKKREKKEKKKEKKEKEKQHISHDVKTNKVKKSLAFHKDEDENEQLDRSGLSEEHEQPIGREKPSSSCDSTQNSCKRKRNASPPAIIKREESAIRDSGNLIRSRLASQKQPVPNALVTRDEEHCSTSGRTELPTQLKDHTAFGVDKEKVFLTQHGETNVINVLPSRRGRELVSSTSGKKEAVIREFSRTDPGYKTPNKELLKVALQYRDLINNWIPPPLQTELDQDWLITKKNPDNQVQKKLKASNVSCCGSSSTLWPRAQFLPEADIYALPFTVPF